MVVGSMPDRDRLRVILTRLLEEERVAQVARRFFDALILLFGIFCDIRARGDEGIPVSHRGLLHEARVLRGFGTQLVIKMRDDERVALLVKCAKQTEAIRTAGDTRDNG